MQRRLAGLGDARFSELPFHRVALKTHLMREHHVELPQRDAFNFTGQIGHVERAGQLRCRRRVIDRTLIVQRTGLDLQRQLARERGQRR